MDSDKIRYFLTLADTLSYTKAAEQLYISQSMLSRHIKSVEDEIGMTLFARNTHGVTLTPAGSFMAKGLRNLSSEYNFLIEQARIANSGFSGRVRIGVVVGCTLDRLSDIISRYETRHPEVQIVISTVESPDEMYNELMKGRIDLGLGMRMGSLFPKLSSLKVCRNMLCIAMSKRHRLAGSEPYSLSMSDFRDETFITPVDDISTAYRELTARCAKAGFAPKVVTVPNIMSVALQVELNRGVTFLHERSTFLRNPNLTFSYLNDVDSDGSSIVYWEPTNTEPKVLAFLDYVRFAVESEKKKA